MYELLVVIVCSLFAFAVWSTRLVAYKQGGIDQKGKQGLRSFCPSPMDIEAHSTLLVCNIRELKCQFPTSLPRQTEAVSALLKSCRILLKATRHYTHTLIPIYIPQGIKQNLWNFFLLTSRLEVFVEGLTLKINPWVWPAPCLQEVWGNTSALSVDLNPQQEHMHHYREMFEGESKTAENQWYQRRCQNNSFKTCGQLVPGTKLIFTGMSLFARRECSPVFLAAPLVSGRFCIHEMKHVSLPVALYLVLRT